MLTNKDKETAHYLLSCDDQGNFIGSNEVCAIEPTPTDRIPAVTRLLQSEDEFTRWRAAAALCAWGEKKGFDYLIELARSGDSEVLSVPHRLHGENNFYDQLAHDLDRYSYTSTEHEVDIKNGLRLLLARYGQNFFERFLKSALLDLADPELLNETCEALEAAWSAGREYQASQLLPVIYKTNEAIGKTYLARFLKLPSQTPDPRHNVIEALGYSQDLATLPMLEKYSQSTDSALSFTAKEAVKAFKYVHKLS